MSTTADLSKLTGYAVTGGSADSAPVSKFIGYAVIDIAARPNTELSKLIGYAVTCGSRSVANDAKLIAYGILVNRTTGQMIPLCVNT
jgi:hypothetical protein